MEFLFHTLLAVGLHCFMIECLDSFVLFFIFYLSAAASPSEGAGFPPPPPPPLPPLPPAAELKSLGLSCPLPFLANQSEEPASHYSRTRQWTEQRHVYKVSKTNNDLHQQNNTLHGCYSRPSYQVLSVPPSFCPVFLPVCLSVCLSA